MSKYDLSKIDMEKFKAKISNFNIPVPYKVHKMITESERREREKKEANKRFWLGLIIGFILGIAASYIASYLWLLFGVK